MHLSEVPHFHTKEIQEVSEVLYTYVLQNVILGK